MDHSDLTNAIIKGKRKDAKKLVSEAIDEKQAPEEILGAMVGGMDVVGERFKNNEIFVPEMLIAARAMKTGMDLLEPVLTEAGLQPEHKAIVGTVKGDLHDIGKNLVVMMFKGANLDVIDLGTDVAPEAFVEAIKEHNPTIVGLSALLTTTMPMMEATITAIRDAGLDTKVLVGGAPVTADYADSIGANGYADDAATAVTLVRELISA